MASATPANVVCEGGVCRFVDDVPEAPSTAANGSTSKLQELLGDALIGKDGKEVSVASLSAPGKYVGLYFSAHWCPPCRGFTPFLASVYEKFKAEHVEKDNWEVVFVSSDRDEESWKEYFEEMPWLALPFADRQRKGDLGKKFKVQGIPTLVILDAHTGEVITTKGTEVLQEDEEAAAFPWREQPFNEVIAGDLVDAKGTVVAADKALAGKVKLMYFSAHWCPPCRRFTPELVKTYNKLRADGKNVEVVFVSSDRDEGQFQEYLGEMPWLAVPFADRKKKAKLSGMFEVEGIPSLAVVDEDDKVITMNGRPAVMSDPEGKNFPWHPKPVEELSEANISLVNDQPVVVVALDLPESEEVSGRGNQLLEDVALSVKAQVKAGTIEDVGFLFGRKSEDTMTSILEFAKAAKMPGDVLVLLDIPSQALCKFQGDVTQKAVEQFVKDFLDGKLDMVNLADLASDEEDA